MLLPTFLLSYRPLTHAESVTLLAGSSLRLAIAEDIDSGKVKVGDRFLLAVYEDVTAKPGETQITLIPHGSVAVGRVVWVRKRDLSHAIGGLGITVESLSAGAMSSDEVVTIKPDGEESVPASNDDPGKKSPLRYNSPLAAWTTTRNCGAPDPTADEFLKYYARLTNGDIKEAIRKVSPSLSDAQKLRDAKFRNSVVENAQIVFHKVFDDSGLRSFLGTDAYDRVKPLMDEYRGRKLPQLIAEVGKGNALAIAQFAVGIATLVDAYESWRRAGNVRIAAGTIIPVRTGTNLRFTLGGPATMGLSPRVRSRLSPRTPASLSRKAKIRAATS